MQVKTIKKTLVAGIIAVTCYGFVHVLMYPYSFKNLYYKDLETLKKEPYIGNIKRLQAFDKIKRITLKNYQLVSKSVGGVKVYQWFGPRYNIYKISHFNISTLVEKQTMDSSGKSKKLLHQFPFEIYRYYLKRKPYCLTYISSPKKGLVAYAIDKDTFRIHYINSPIGLEQAYTQVKDKIFATLNKH